MHPLSQPWMARHWSLSCQLHIMSWSMFFPMEGASLCTRRGYPHPQDRQVSTAVLVALWWNTRLHCRNYGAFGRWSISLMTSDSQIGHGRTIAILWLQSKKKWSEGAGLCYLTTHHSSPRIPLKSFKHWLPRPHKAPTFHKWAPTCWHDTIRPKRVYQPCRVTSMTWWC